jgi:hypothetical protein
MVAYGLKVDLKRMIKAFLWGLLAFVLANAISVLRSDDSDVPHGVNRFGFPILIQEQGEALNHFNQAAFWSDLGIAIVVSGVTAFFYVKRHPRYRHRHRHRFQRQPSDHSTDSGAHGIHVLPSH